MPVHNVLDDIMASDSNPWTSNRLFTACPGMSGEWIVIRDYTFSRLRLKTVLTNDNFENDH
jgi:hypothetical protein